jgi:NTE family protein
MVKVGLALSGGGARGFAHVGVIKVLVENGIPIDVVAGTSAGAIVGGAFAAGLTPDGLYQMAENVHWLNMTRPSLSLMGLLSNAPMGGFIKRHFPIEKIEDCCLPFASVACRPSTGEEVVFTSGDIAFGIRASCAVPGVFAPLREKDGGFLVDGGVVSPLPISAARALGADVIIAVDLMACGATFRPRPRSGAGLAIQSTMTLLRTLSSTQHKYADVVITPQIAHLRPDRISTRDECIALGAASAAEKLDAIKSLLASI